VNDPRLKQHPTGGGFTASPFFVPSAEAAESPHFPQARPLRSPPRPACGQARPFPPLCPSKPATARRPASLARPPATPCPSAVAAPPLCPLDGPPRPAEARPLVSARRSPPKPATGRGSPLPPARRPASPPCPPAVGLPAPSAPSAVAARPPGAPAVRLPLARRRPPWRGDHRPPPPGLPPGAPPARPARKKPVKNRNLTRQPRIKHGCKKVVKVQTVSIQKEWENPLLTSGFHNRGQARPREKKKSPNR
jgi:hypothetical protein